MPIAEPQHNLNLTINITQHCNRRINLNSDHREIPKAQTMSSRIIKMSNYQQETKLQNTQWNKNSTIKKKYIYITKKLQDAKTHKN